MKKGMCIQRAKNTAWREAREEGKAIMELVSAVVSAGSGAKGGGGRSGTLPTRHHTPLKISELDWKGFVEKLDMVLRGTYGKAHDVNDSASALMVDEKIYSESDAIVGLVKYFD